MKILNLYSGIGGNRKLWDDVIEAKITAVEHDEKIAEIYQDLFPGDQVIIADAHEYLRKNMDDYDFIWSSPPCPTHSKTQYFTRNNDKERGNHKWETAYPDMRLYQEILLLKHFYHGEYCVENVVSYYDPLIQPQKRHRHYFWASFSIPDIRLDSDQITKDASHFQDRYGFDLSGYSGIDKRQLLRNCVHPELGKVILQSAVDRQEVVYKDQPLFSGEQTTQ